MNEVNLELLAQRGTSDIFLNYKAFTRYGEASVLDWIEDANEFCETAKKYELLLVPGDDFGCPGYVRISYCVTTEQIERALPAFEKLAGEYNR